MKTNMWNYSLLYDWHRLKLMHVSGHDKRVAKLAFLVRLFWPEVVDYRLSILYGHRRYTNSMYGIIDWYWHWLKLSTLNVLLVAVEIRFIFQRQLKKLKYTLAKTTLAIWNRGIQLLFLRKLLSQKQQPKETITWMKTFK